MLCLLLQTLLPKGVKGLVDVLVPSTPRAFKRRLWGTLARTMAHQRMTHTQLQKSSPFLQADIKVFIQSNPLAKFTLRAVARIMHGISSPSFPSATWSKKSLVGRYVEVYFPLVMEAAKAEHWLNLLEKENSPST